MKCFKVFDSMDSRPIGSYAEDTIWPSYLNFDEDESLEDKIQKKLKERDTLIKKLNSIRMVLDKKQETIRIKDKKERDETSTVHQTEKKSKLDKKKTITKIINSSLPMDTENYSQYDKEESTIINADNTFIKVEKKSICNEQLESYLEDAKTSNSETNLYSFRNNTIIKTSPRENEQNENLGKPSGDFFDFPNNQFNEISKDYAIDTKAIEAENALIKLAQDHSEISHRRIRKLTIDSVKTDFSKISYSFMNSFMNVIQDLDNVIKSHEVPFHMSRDDTLNSANMASEFQPDRNYKYDEQSDSSDDDSSDQSNQTLLIPDPLDKYSYYLPHFSGKNSEIFLKKLKIDCLFLLRGLENLNFKYAISVYYQRKVYHLKIRETKKGFAIGDPKKDEKIFKSVPDIIDYFINNPLRIPNVKPFRFKLDPMLRVYAYNFESKYGIEKESRHSSTLSRRGKISK